LHVPTVEAEGLGTFVAQQQSVSQGNRAREGLT
jgi:hypothetical protein